MVKDPCTGSRSWVDIVRTKAYTFERYFFTGKDRCGLTRTNPSTKNDLFCVFNVRLITIFYDTFLSTQFLLLSSRKGMIGRLSL